MNTKKQTNSNVNTQNREWSENDKFNYHWNKIVREIAYGYCANPNVPFEIKNGYLDKDLTMKIMSILVYKGIIDNFQLGFSACMSKNKNLFAQLNSVKVFGVNPDVDENFQKQVKIQRYNFAKYSTQVEPITEICKANGETPQGDFDRHIAEINERSNKEYISKEDRVKRTVEQV